MATLAIPTNIHAELVATHNAFLTAIECSASFTHVESDSLKVVNLIKTSYTTRHAFGVIIDDKRKILTDSMGFYISHIFCEAS